MFLFHLFEIGSTNPLFQKLKPIFTLAILASCLSIRWLRAYDAVYCKYDAFITVPIIYSLVTLCNYCKPLTIFLQYFGNHSTYMWLTHTFFCLYYFRPLVLSTDISLLMFAATIGMSLATAWLLNELERHITTWLSKK